MDAHGIDPRGFTAEFCRQLTGSEIAPVRDRNRHAMRHGSVCGELTRLPIPGENDSPAELEARRIARAAGPRHVCPGNVHDKPGQST